MKKAFAIVYRDTNEIFQVRLRNAGLNPTRFNCIFDTEEECYHVMEYYISVIDSYMFDIVPVEVKCG